MVQSPIQQRFVDHQVVPALIRADLSSDSPVRERLNSDAEIIGPPGDGFLRMRNSRGELVPVEGRIEELKADPNYSAYFPDLPKIGLGEDQIRENFDRIARGEVQVMK